MKMLAVTLAAVASLWSAADVHAQTVIASLPYVVSASGTYVLDSNLSSSQTSGNLISIIASNVTIDLRGHYLSGPVNNTGQMTYAIVANERSNITIKNGTIAHCFGGIYLGGNGTATTNSVDHQIDNVRVTYCSFIGIYIDHAQATRVTNCQISQIGYNGAANAYGIGANGTGTTVRGNVVSSVTATNSVGVSVMQGSFVRRNKVSNAATGISGGTYQDNLTANCPTAYAGGTDAGGNN